MTAASFVRHLYYCRVSKPSHERIIYQRIQHERATRLVELGMGRATRSTRMIEVARRCGGGRTVDYTGIDLFEARECGPAGLSLKVAFRILRPLDIRLRLVPGDALSGLARCANYLVGTDVVVISADQQDMAPMDRVWPYLPRMLHKRSLVFVEQRGAKGLEMKIMSSAQVEAVAAMSARRQRLAA